MFKNKKKLKKVTSASRNTGVEQRGLLTAAVNDYGGYEAIEDSSLMKTVENNKMSQNMKTMVDVGNVDDLETNRHTADYAENKDIFKSALENGDLNSKDE